MIRLHTDFECGAGRVQQLEAARWRLDTVGDPFGYNRYFCTRAINETKHDAVVELQVYPDATLGTTSNFLTHFPSHIWYCYDGEERWVPLRHTWENAVHFADDHIALHVPLRAGTSMRIATNPVLSYSDCLAWCNLQPGRDSIGKSYEGRDIPVLRMGRGSRRLLVMAGMHASEHCGVYAARGIVEYLQTRIVQATRIMSAFDIAVIPMFNPDGNVHGYSGATAQRLDINPSMDFAEASPRTHENQVLWQWIESTFAPDLLLHFHGYMGWKRGADAPFDGLYCLTDPPHPDLHQAILDRLRFETPAFSAHWPITGEIGEAMLEYQLAKRWNTLPFLYEINAGAVGPGEQWRRGPQILSAIASGVDDDRAS